MGEVWMSVTEQATEDDLRLSDGARRHLMMLGEHVTCELSVTERRLTRGYTHECWRFAVIVRTLWDAATVPQAMCKTCLEAIRAARTLDLVGHA